MARGHCQIPHGRDPGPRGRKPNGTMHDANDRWAEVYNEIIAASKEASGRQAAERLGSPPR